MLSLGTSGANSTAKMAHIDFFFSCKFQESKILSEIQNVIELLTSLHSADELWTIFLLLENC